MKTYRSINLLVIVMILFALLATTVNSKPLEPPTDETDWTTLPISETGVFSPFAVETGAPVVVSISGKEKNVIVWPDVQSIRAMREGAGGDFYPPSGVPASIDTNGRSWEEFSATVPGDHPGQILIAGSEKPCIEEPCPGALVATVLNASTLQISGGNEIETLATFAPDEDWPSDVETATYPDQKGWSIGYLRFDQEMTYSQIIGFRGAGTDQLTNNVMTELWKSTWNGKAEAFAFSSPDELVIAWRNDDTPSPMHFLSTCMIEWENPDFPLTNCLQTSLFLGALDEFHVVNIEVIDHPWATNGQLVFLDVSEAEATSAVWFGVQSYTSDPSSFQRLGFGDSPAFTFTSEQGVIAWVREEGGIDFAQLLPGTGDDVITGETGSISVFPEDRFVIALTPIGKTLFRFPNLSQGVDVATWVLNSGTFEPPASTNYYDTWLPMTLNP